MFKDDWYKDVNPNLDRLAELLGVGAKSVGINHGYTVAENRKPEVVTAPGVYFPAEKGEVIPLSPRQEGGQVSATNLPKNSESAKMEMMNSIISKINPSGIETKAVMGLNFPPESLKTELEKFKILSKAMDIFKPQKPPSEKKEGEKPPAPTAMEMRKKQGPGFYQADIGEETSPMTPRASGGPVYEYGASEQREVPAVPYSPFLMSRREAKNIRDIYAPQRSEAQVRYAPGPAPKGFPSLPAPPPPMTLPELPTAYNMFDEKESDVLRKRKDAYDLWEDDSWFSPMISRQGGGMVTPDLDDIVDEASQAYGVPKELIRSVIQIESSRRPNAVSEAGAQGYMQIMPETAKELGIKNAFDPIENVFGGTKYLSTRPGQTWEDKLLAYHGGPGPRGRKYVADVMNLYKGVVPNTEMKETNLPPPNMALSEGINTPQEEPSFEPTPLRDKVIPPSEKALLEYARAKERFDKWRTQYPSDWSDETIKSLAIADRVWPGEMPRPTVEQASKSPYIYINKPFESYPISREDFLNLKNPAIPPGITTDVIRGKPYEAEPKGVPAGTHTRIPWGGPMAGTEVPAPEWVEAWQKPEKETSEIRTFETYLQRKGIDPKSIAGTPRYEEEYRKYKSIGPEVKSEIEARDLLSDQDASWLSAKLANREMSPTQLRTFIGFGAVGQKNLSKIVKNLRKDYPEYNFALAELAYTGDKTEINKNKQLQASVLTFEKTAIQNAKQVTALSQKISSTRIPILNDYIISGKTLAGGSPEEAQYIASWRTLINEYARIATSVTGGGITSDAARREIETVLRKGYTREQVESVVKQLVLEMEHRRYGFEKGLHDVMTNWGQKPDFEPKLPTAEDIDNIFKTETPLVGSAGKGSQKMPFPTGKTYSNEDLEYTAKKHGITIEEVKKRLGVK